MANKTRNFQSGTSGREKGAITFTFKARGKKGTKAINARCGGKGDKGEVCKRATALYLDAVERFKDMPSDEEEREGAPKRKRKSHKGD